MKTLLLFLVVIAASYWLYACSGKPKSLDPKDDTFSVGQVWAYHTRTGEEHSTFQILKIEEYEETGTVIHIYVNGLKVKNPHIPSGFSEEIGHLPMSKEAVSKSITNLVSEDSELHDFKEGYGNWKQAFDDGKAGVFSATVKEAVEYVEGAMDNAQQINE